MKQSQGTPNSLEHIRKGNFVDVNNMERCSEWEIYDLIQGKMYVRGLRDQNLKQILDINHPGVRLFRTYTRGTELVLCYHRFYCYWSEGLPWALQIIRRVNQSTDLLGEMGIVDIVQFWRGKNYLLALSMNDTRKITQENSNLIFEYIQQFLNFFSRYWQILNLRGLSEKKLYTSEQNALMLSYHEIMINLGSLLMRKSYLDNNLNQNYQGNGGATFGCQALDKSLLHGLEWVRSKFIPALLATQDFAHLNYEVVFKACTILSKLVVLNRLQRTPEVASCIVKLIKNFPLLWPQSSIAKLNEYSQQIATLMMTLNQKQPEYFQFLKWRLRLLIISQDYMKTYITHPHEKINNTNKNMTILLKACDHINEDAEVKELIRQFLNHEYGLPFYFEIASLSNDRQLVKLFKLYPTDYIIQAIKKRKTECIKFSSIWTPQLLLQLLEQYLKLSTTMQKQDLAFSVNIQKLITNELLLLQRTMALDKKFSNEETFKKLKKQLPFLNVRIVSLCEAFCDAMEKTMTIEYVEKCILQSYIVAEEQNIVSKMQTKETNNFRQNFIYRVYISKYLPKSEGKNAVISTFHKLCENMAFLKAKSHLESRKQNLIALLTRCFNHYSTQITPLICQYIECVKRVQNREFKTRALQFLPAFLGKYNLSKNNPEERIEAEKKFISAMKIQNANQLRVFFELFKHVNYYDNRIKLTEESNIPLIVYKRPYGFDKLLQGFSYATDRILIKRLINFFTRIQFKIADEVLRTEIMQQITEKAIDFLAAAVNSNENVKIQEQYARDIVDLIESLMSFQMDPNSTTIGTDYPSIFSEKTSLSSVKVGTQLLSNSSSVQKLEKISKRVRVSVRIWDPTKTNSDLNENEILDQQILQVSPDEKLYYLKDRAASHFEMSPILSSFYSNGQKISHLDQTMTVGHLICAQSKKQESIRAQEMAETKKSQISLTEKMKQERLAILLFLRAHQNDYVVRETLMKKIDVVYFCLPYTSKIWSNLNILPHFWQTNPLLIQVKHKFFKTYPDESTRQKQYLNMTAEEKTIVNDWNGFVEEPLKKKYLFEGLLCSELMEQTGNLDWVLDSFNDMSSCKIEIENNILSIQLMEKLKIKFHKPEDLQKLFLKLRISDPDQTMLSSQQLKEIDKLHQLLLDKVFGYIEAHVEFNLLHFLLTLKQSINQSIQNRNFYLKICWLLKNLFTTYILTDYENFFENAMLSYINQYPNNFGLLLMAINHISWEEDPALIPIFQSGLSYIIKLMIAQRQARAGVSENAVQINHQLIQFACCLISKNIRCEELYLPEFRNILHMLLFSKQEHASLHIITCLISESIGESEYYVNYFRKEMNEAEWDKKDFIKFNRGNLRPETGFVGLINPHSICYVNSLLQQLYHIQSFRRELYLAKWKKNDCVEEDLIYQLKKIFLNLNFRQCEAYINRNFFEAFKNDEGGATSMEIQMDVDEFRNILLDRIQNMIAKPQSECRNFVQKIFNGKQLTIIKSKDCSHESSREQEFSSICLQVKGLKNLDGALQHYFKPEILNEENKYFCEDCNKKVVAEKKNVIKQYPKYLTFVLKRFEYVIHIRRKINERFEFPLNTFEISKGVKYSLKGVIVHQGLSQAGHYFSLIKVNGKWYEFNDNQVMEIHQINVIAYGYGQSNGKSNKNAYLLIYEKISDGQAVTCQDSIAEVLQYQFGIEDEINEIRRHNSLVWKSSLFFSRQFESFVEKAVKNRIEGSVSMLFQYILTIRAKFPKIDIKTMKYFLELLETYATSCLISSDAHVEWAVKFYRNSHFNPAKKSALTNIIVNKYTGFNEYIQKFLTRCLILLHSQIETSPLYYLFFRLSQVDPGVLKFLVNHRIIGRIYDISFPNILFTLHREELSKGEQISFPMIQPHKLEKKKAAESSELRYRKWQLINYIVRSGVELHRLEKGYIDGWYDLKNQHIFEEATCKSNINQISQFFTHLSTNNHMFSGLYLNQICEQISKDKSDLLRKYLKAAFDILNINDSYRVDRFKRIKQVFAESFRKLYGMRILSSFDVKWQWFIKICFYNLEFRNYVQPHFDEFKILFSKNELNSWYFSRNEITSEGKQRNKYYGIKFSTSTSSNLALLEEKIERTKLIFDHETPQGKFKQIYMKQYNFDTTLIDFPQTQIKTGSVLLKYFDTPACFKEVLVDDVLGDIIEINENLYERGDERLMCLPQQINQTKMEEQNEIMCKKEEQPKNQPKIESDLNQFGVS